MATGRERDLHEGFDRTRATEEIRRLILAYPDMIDAGDIDGVASLLDGVRMCTSYGVMARPVPDEEMRPLGADEIRSLYSGVILHGDAVPRTRHITSNIDVWFADGGVQAGSRCHCAVLQGMEGLPLQFVVAGRLEDSFRSEGGAWRLTVRRHYIDLVGDTSRFLDPGVLRRLGIPV